MIFGIFENMFEIEIEKKEWNMFFVDDFCC
jgi:hypothetical protein